MEAVVLKNHLGEYKSIERFAHITLDDVMNKVTQEVGELIEASIEGNDEEMYKEAGDVLVNIFSVNHELGIDINLEKTTSEKSPLKLSVLLGKWNTKIQSLRNRYSREKVDLNEVGQITKDLVGEVLNFSDPSMSLNQVIERNVQKFDSRKELYKSQIDLKDYIGNYPDFPKPGINFKDISPMLQSKEALRYAVLEMAQKCSESDVIVGLDARGFIFGSLVAKNLGKPFVMLRKKGKLPGATREISYGLEYGKDILEIQSGVIQKGQKVSVIDDLLATGGTVKAAIDLVEGEGGEINNLVFAISLDEKGLVKLDSRKKVAGYKIDSLVSYV
ncbi:adenine phosphoribosyltransferase [Candidatus Gracilibacteria bacterium]|nr:adenine phosphoribosyltransferase [Candidatus Gracilibacteria bacterium]